MQDLGQGMPVGEKGDFGGKGGFAEHPRCACVPAAQWETSLMTEHVLILCSSGLSTQ